jgi:hypothetical protein
MHCLASSRPIGIQRRATPVTLAVHGNVYKIHDSTPPDVKFQSQKKALDFFLAFLYPVMILEKNVLA